MMNRELDTTVTIWGDWFGSYASRPAARRYLTMQWTGSRVPDSANWIASDTRMMENGRWQVRLAEHPYKKEETT
jgi:hypothetical protein